MTHRDLMKTIMLDYIVLKRNKDKRLHEEVIKKEKLMLNIKNDGKTSLVHVLFLHLI